jgi:hypothetical protein
MRGVSGLFVLVLVFTCVSASRADFGAERMAQVTPMVASSSTATAQPSAPEPLNHAWLWAQAILKVANLPIYTSATFFAVSQEGNVAKVAWGVVGFSALSYAVGSVMSAYYVWRL